MLPAPCLLLSSILVGDPIESTACAAFRDAAGFKKLKCLKNDEALSFDSTSKTWSVITNADAATIAKELSTNLAKYKGCAVRVEE